MNWCFKSGFLLTLFLFSYTCYSQLSSHGKPYSFSSTLKAAKLIPLKDLDPLEINSLIAKDKIEGINNRFGIVQNLNIDLKAEGVKTIIADKGYIWQYSLNCSNSFSLGVTFSNFKLPEGASLFVYSQDHLQILGAFTKANNKTSEKLTVAPLVSNNLIIEYFEPITPEFYGSPVISSISKAYKNVFSGVASILDVNCPAGNNWQTEKHAVCRMIFEDAGESWLCSGALVNNTNNDGKPYFLTANHCISSNTSAESLITYFNYESTSCNGSIPSSNKNQTLSGATLLTHNQGTDYSLLLLNEMPPAEYSPYFAGWDASGAVASEGTCIHHPEGLKKCIAADYNTITSFNREINWDNTNITARNTHWEAIFNVGIILGGSSGSPLFNEKHRVIGQLHGGGEDTAYYGKLSLSWNADAIISNRVSAYLDSKSTGTKVLDGMGEPLPGFYARPTDACIATPIRLIDTSLYSPTGWKWEIYPLNNIQFINGTSDTSQFPVIVINNYGNYKVVLKVSNNYGSKSVVKSNYISVMKKLPVTFSRVPEDSSICGKNLSSFAFVAAGADSFKFSSALPETMTVNQFNDSSAYYSLNSGLTNNTSFSTYLIVNGWHGICSGTDSLNLNILYPINDNVANAIELKLGKNGPFNNKCATVEKNEPFASTRGCTSSIGWCYDVKNPTITVNNTLWFTFKGPSNNNIIIDTYGFDDRIAVYNSASASDIVSGNQANYNIIAANDNRSDAIKSAYLGNVAVQSGQTYWLQLDGFQGAYGDAIINLSSYNLDVSPNPNNGKFAITLSYPNETTVQVEVYSVIGKLMYKNSLNISSALDQFSFDFSNFAAGIYYFVVHIESETLKTKLLIINGK